MRALDLLATLLLIIGGLNWGLVAFDFNLVTRLFGEHLAIVNGIYMAVGIAALYRLFKWCSTSGR